MRKGLPTVPNPTVKSVLPQFTVGTVWHTLVRLAAPLFCCHISVSNSDADSLRLDGLFATVESSIQQASNLTT